MKSQFNFSLFDVIFVKLKKLQKFSFFIFSFSFFSIPALPAVASIYSLPNNGDDVIGQLYTITVKNNDSFDTLRARYEVSERELRAANKHINFYNLKVGTKIVIPEEFILPLYRQGIVINMPELRLYYFMPDGRHVFTAPVAMGRPNWRTPTIATQVIKKEPNPIWHVPTSIKRYMLEEHGINLPDVVPHGPQNPLGNYAMYLAKRGYLIHGTNQPESVGTFASSGCMRMSSTDLEFLYMDVTVGTPVYILNHAHKAGWLKNKLYLESHVAVDLNESPNELNSIGAETAIDLAAKQHSANIEWEKVRAVVNLKSGLPTVVGAAR